MSYSLSSLIRRDVRLVPIFLFDCYNLWSAHVSFWYKLLIVVTCGENICL